MQSALEHLPGTWSLAWSSGQAEAWPGDLGHAGLEQ